MKDRRGITQGEILDYRKQVRDSELPDEELVKTAAFSMWLFGHRAGKLMNEASRNLRSDMRRIMRRNR